MFLVPASPTKEVHTYNQVSGEDETGRFQRTEDDQGEVKWWEYRKSTWHCLFKDTDLIKRLEEAHQQAQAREAHNPRELWLNMLNGNKLVPHLRPVPKRHYHSLFDTFPSERPVIESGYTYHDGRQPRQADLRIDDESQLVVSKVIKPVQGDTVYYLPTDILRPLGLID